MLLLLHLFTSLVNISPMAAVADLLGTTPAALKLLLSLLMGYPWAILYHKYVHQHDVNIKHYFFILVGIDLALINFGISMYHTMIPLLVMYITSKAFPPGKVHSLLTFIFNITYLLIGYIQTESEDYDITWTMPQCVLTLKMISLSFDLWDGRKMQKGETLSDHGKKNALYTPPTFVELLGFVYFPACFLVGPIFSFRRYSDFVSGKFPIKKEDDRLQRQSLHRLIQGISYIAAFQLGSYFFSMSYMQSDEFDEHSIIYKHVYCGLWAHFALYKYVACWLITEAACIRFGLSYNGIKRINEHTVEHLWDGCCNIKLLKFEFATKFQHYIDSFNLNTNNFAAEYVYKRLKFLGNRNLSQFFTLLFLALWHGTQSGYYLTFLNEFLIIVFEKDIQNMFKDTALYNIIWSSTIGKYTMYFLLKLYTIVFMGWSLAPFDLKTFSKWWPIYKSLYFSGFVLFLPWLFMYKPLVLKAIKKYKYGKKSEDTEHKKYY